MHHQRRHHRSVPRKRDNPALPVTVPEQIESTHAAYEASAALVHVHIRNDDEGTVQRLGDRGGSDMTDPVVAG